MSSSQKPVTPAVNRLLPDSPQAAALTQSWRDLHWLLHSPALLAPGFSATYPPAVFPEYCLQQIKQWMEQEQEHPATLNNRFEFQFRRLGLYAEKLLKTGLEQCADIQLLLDHFPIHLEQAQANSPKKSRQTLGEVDFIWQDRQSREIFHWELAVKLYLYVPQSEAPELDQEPHGQNEFHRLVGTQLKDTLYKKTQRLFTHQLLLASHPQITQAIGNNVDHACPYLRGWLFYPLQTQAWDSYLYPNKATMSQLNPAHNKGWWLRLPHFLARLHQQPVTVRWAILPRLHWLSQAQVPQDQTLDAVQLQAKLERHFTLSTPTEASPTPRFPPEPLLLAALQESTRYPGCYEEIHRGFVSSQTWARA
ncbi:MAG: DUF1853 family protein [Alcaligenaceae bacterium]|nr:DUF1853 family protein [Alcaligenaceae bacterium]